jgi:hypothetical protein
LIKVWVPHDVRDLVVDFVRCWSEKTEIGIGRFIHWLGVRASKFYDWRERYGRVNEHNGWVPRLLSLSTNSKQIVAENSGHFIIIDRPDVVIDAIGQVVHSVRNHSKL